MSDIEETELSSMTVPELKKALKAKGLSATGKKEDLIERLQLAMGSDDNDPNNDTDLLEDANELLGEDDDDEIVVPAPSKKVVIKRDNPPPATTPAETEAPAVTSPKKTEESTVSPNKIEAPAPTSPVAKVEEKKSDSIENITIKKWTDEERAAKRAARFQASADESKKADLTSDSKKESRAERFGLPVGSTKKIGAAPSADLETLKKRAERFGASSSTVMKKAEMDEKIKKRQERFGAVENVEPSKKMKKTEILEAVEINATLKDEKMVKRAERFGIKA